ncbi:MAG TPA: ABC transporter ATP-binding protein [Candidatus Binatia bacterium]|nr:ABC transporter ATP-binding protein [Candidatus Binatia bacterium]
MIVVERLTKQFGATRAIDGVSFHVGRGEIIGLLGPNGSGKTTIMRILTGFFPPTSGRATVAGVDVSADALALRRQIGYLPESVALYPDMRVRAFLRFCAEVRGLLGDTARRRIADVMDACGLGEVAGRLIGKLSKGYRQRVGLAQALLHRPAVLILDEPTVGLDPRQIIEIRALIAGLRGQTTVLLSTHILPEVSTTCDRVVIIDHGRIVAEDTAAALAQRVAGSERTLITVDGPAESVSAAVRSVPGVERVEVKNGTGDGFTTVVAYSARGDASVRKSIAATVVRQGWGLLEVRPLALTLEDLFVRLVNEEGTPPRP